MAQPEQVQKVRSIVMTSDGDTYGILFCMQRESFEDDARPQKRARDQPTEQPSEQLAVAATEAAVTCTVSELQALFTKEADEHEFDCPVSGCHGKIVMNADLCRFGHGVKAMCRLQDDKAATASSTHHSHISKWCRVMYAFIPAEMWVEHLSCCSGLSFVQAQCAIVDVGTFLPQVAQQGSDSQTRTADDASSAVVASENGEEKCYGRGQAAPPSRNTVKEMQVLIFWLLFTYQGLLVWYPDAQSTATLLTLHTTTEADIGREWQ